MNELKTEAYVRTGSCLCGAITYKITGEMAKVTACHCSQCRKQTGTYYSASTIADDQIEIHDERDRLNWYSASEQAQRGFCSNCGSAMFWKRNSSKNMSVLVGTLDGESGLEFGKHIFAESKGDYYELPEDQTQFPEDG